MTSAERKPARAARPARRFADRRKISIFGATGSVGLNTVAVIEEAGGADRFEVVAVTAGRNAEALAEVARKLRARLAVVADEAALPELRSRLEGSGTVAMGGAQALADAASEPCDWAMASIVGVAGLAPALAAASAGADIALANKEALVSAGGLFLDAVAQGGGALLPVDSEHSAIFHLFDPARAEQVEKITLTASGGPFREWSVERMASARPADALKHPNWSMGAKISIDSATMFNKGLEIIEAARLFRAPSSRIEALIHPQSIIHGLVSYADGSVLAHLGAPDMRTPIAAALSWPEGMRIGVERLDLARISRLDFCEPDETRFPALRISREALEIGGAAPIALNAANEAAVAAFLRGEIGFLDIADRVSRGVEDALAEFGAHEPASLDAVMAIDAFGRRSAATAPLA